MKKPFRITFGSSHTGTAEIPVNGNGWVHLWADDYDTARAATIKMFGGYWSDLIEMTDKSDYPWHLFPAGQLHILVVNEFGQLERVRP